MIRIRDLEKRFGDNHVLRGVSFDVHDGKTRVILGLSGSGKSVLMKHIIGLMRPDSGHIFVDGEDITTYNQVQLLELRKKFGMVFQDAALFDSMNIFDNVAFPLREHTKLSEAEIKKRVEEKLSLVNLVGAQDRFASQISGGMRKRVALARAVILEPRYVLYDEPTTGLDPIMTDSVDDMIINAARDFHVTSLVISHDLRSALNVADDIVVLHRGEVVEDCKPHELKNSKHPFVQEYLASWYGERRAKREAEANGTP